MDLSFFSIVDTSYISPFINMDSDRKVSMQWSCYKYYIIDISFVENELCLKVMSAVI